MDSRPSPPGLEVSGKMPKADNPVGISSSAEMFLHLEKSPGCRVDAEQGYFLFAEFGNP